MTDSDAKTAFGAIHPVLTESWVSSFRNVREVLSHPYYDARLKSMMLQNEAVKLVRDALEGEFGAKHHCRHSQHIFTFPGLAHVVFKQLDEHRLPCRGKTPHADQFYSKGSLDGLQDLPRLIVGAVPSKDWTEIIGVFLTSPNRKGRANNWELDITLSAEPTDINQVRMDFMGDKNNTQTRKNPYRPKNATKQRTEGQDGDTADAAEG